MELSCESMRYPEDKRPTSCKFVELHVLYVPDDQWNVKLNKVPAEAIESFISAGFIRVYPDVTLRSLRGELGALLGAERSIDKFSFLKCVGRSLALVKSKQERDLKVKTFAPPYAPQPELYLLPAVDSDSSVCSQSSLTPDTGSSSSPEQQQQQQQHAYYQLPKTCGLPAGTKEPVKFPVIPRCSRQHPPTTTTTTTPTPGREDEQQHHGYTSSEAEEGENENNEEEGRSSNRPEWAEHQCCQRALQPASQNDKASQRCEAGLVPTKDFFPPEREETCGNDRRQQQQQHGPMRTARDPGAAQSLGDRDSGFSLTDGLGKTKDGNALKPFRNKPVTESPGVLSRPVRCTSPPPGMDSVTQKKTSHVFHTNREELVEEIKLVREQRKQLEWTRQELLRKGKDLLAQNRHRRNKARDGWKKKYFQTKKATTPLEENLRNLRQELETFYEKLLHQLQARDNKGKPRRQGRSSIKNELIIQIMTESHEIDNLKRKVEDAKMKLVTEIKLRKQAATELRALKAELAQKKSHQSSPPGHSASMIDRFI